MGWSKRAIRAWAWCARAVWAAIGALLGYCAVEAKGGDGTQAGGVALACGVTALLFFGWGFFCVIRGVLEERK